MANPIACGWAGRYLRSLEYLGKSHKKKKEQNLTDRRTEKAGSRKQNEKIQVASDDATRSN